MLQNHSSLHKLLCTTSLGELTMESAKIRIQIGSFEIEYEDNSDYLKDGLDQLLEKISELSTQMPSSATTEQGQTDSQTSNNNPTFSTNTIAAQLNAKSGSDLVLSALAQIEIVQGQNGASRSDILKEMKSATSYYAKSMGKNMTPQLASLVKSKKIHQNASNSYALSAAERRKIEAALANVE